MPPPHSATPVRLAEIYARDAPVVSCELFPPKDQRGLGRLWRSVALLETIAPDFYSVTYGAGGTTRDMSIQVAEELVGRVTAPVASHITIVDQSKEEIRAVLDHFERAGVENLVAIRGDPPSGQENWIPHPEGWEHTIDLVREVAQRGTFGIAVAGFPEVHPEAPDAATDLGFLVEKLAVGGDVVITQLFFDDRDYFAYVDTARAAGITVPIVPGLLPVLSSAQIRRIVTLCGARIPPDLDHQLAEAGDDADLAREAGIRWTTDQVTDLIAGGAPGIHLYTLNKARATRRILRETGLR